MYRRLDAACIVATLDALCRRVEARFPDAGLASVTREALAIGRETEARAARLALPDIRVRSGVAVVLALAAGALLVPAGLLHPAAEAQDAVDLVTGLEASVNLVILATGGIWFLVSLEERLKRRAALAALHELRSLAHVVDMHQLTKDPTTLTRAHVDTDASPRRCYTPASLTRYLEYCAELQALIAKLAALYAEGVRDSVVIEAVNDIESLCASMGRKVWQKITLIPAA
jgi:hypothetical protein